MGKPVKVVVVGDGHKAALKVASDLEKSGYEPAIFLAPTEAEIERIAPGCELVLAWADATGVPPFRLLVLAAERGDFPPVVILADKFRDDELQFHFTDTGWRLISVDKEKEKLLFLVPYKVFGPALFDRLVRYGTAMLIREERLLDHLANPGEGRLAAEERLYRDLVGCV